MKAQPDPVPMNDQFVSPGRGVTRHRRHRLQSIQNDYGDSQDLRKAVQYFADNPDELEKMKGYRESG